MSAATSPASRRRSWLPDKNPVRIVGAQAFLAFGVLLLVAGVISDWGDYLGSSSAFLTLMGMAWIALAALEVSRPAPDRRAVIVYRLSFFLLPVSALAAFLIGDA